MSKNVVDIAYVEIEGQELETIMTININDTDPNAEVVKTIRRKRRGIGYRKGVPEFEVEIEAVDTIPAEFNWFAKKRAQTELLLVYEEAAGALLGKRFRLEDLLITEVGKEFNAEGTAILKIRCLALDHQEEA